MRLLMLGGTVFLGRHIVENALGRGHTVTLFNRGQRHLAVETRLAAAQQIEVRPIDEQNPAH